MLGETSVEPRERMREQVGSSSCSKGRRNQKYSNRFVRFLIHPLAYHTTIPHLYFNLLSTVFQLITSQTALKYSALRF